MLTDLNFAIVREDCVAYFGIGTIPIPQGTAVLVAADEKDEYGVYANVPETTFVHICKSHLEDTTNE